MRGRRVTLGKRWQAYMHEVESQNLLAHKKNQEGLVDFAEIMDVVCDNA